MKAYSPDYDLSGWLTLDPFEIVSHKTLRPIGNNTFDLGMSGGLWREIFATTGTFTNLTATTMLGQLTLGPSVPVLANHAASKSYVDSAVGGGAAANTLIKWAATPLLVPSALTDDATTVASSLPMTVRTGLLLMPTGTPANLRSIRLMSIDNLSRFTNIYGPGNTAGIGLAFCVQDNDTLNLCTQPTVNGTVTSRLVMDASGNWRPFTNNLADLGGLSNYWRTLHVNSIQCQTLSGARIAVCGTIGAGMYGFGIASGALTIASPSVGTKVGFGYYDSGSVFVEKAYITGAGAASFPEILGTPKMTNLNPDWLVYVTPAGNLSSMRTIRTSEMPDLIRPVCAVDGATPIRNAGTLTAGTWYRLCYVTGYAHSRFTIDIEVSGAGLVNLDFSSHQGIGTTTFRQDRGYNINPPSQQIAAVRLMQDNTIDSGVNSKIWVEVQPATEIIPNYLRWVARVPLRAGAFPVDAVFSESPGEVTNYTLRVFIPLNYATAIYGNEYPLWGACAICLPTSSQALTFQRDGKLVWGMRPQDVFIRSSGSATDNTLIFGAGGKGPAAGSPPISPDGIWMVAGSSGRVIGQGAAARIFRVSLTTTAALSYGITHGFRVKVGPPADCPVVSLRNTTTGALIRPDTITQNPDPGEPTVSNAVSLNWAVAPPVATYEVTLIA